MIFRLRSRSWLRENAAVRGDGDVCDHGGECVRAITPLLLIRRTHSPALAVEIGVAVVAVVRGGITSAQFHGGGSNEGELVNGTYPGEEKREPDLQEKKGKYCAEHT